jgi:hypothetical protein
MQLSSAAIVVRLHHRRPPLPSSTNTAIITTSLSLLSLTALSCSSPSQSATQSRVSSSSATVVICHHPCPPLPNLGSSSLLTEHVDCCVMLTLLVCGRALLPPLSPLIHQCCRLSPAALVTSFPNQPLLVAVELRLSSLLPLDVDCCIVGDTSHIIRTSPQQVICGGINVP